MSAYKLRLGACLQHVKSPAKKGIKQHNAGWCCGVLTWRSERALRQEAVPLKATAMPPGPHPTSALVSKRCSQISSCPSKPSSSLPHAIFASHPSACKHQALTWNSMACSGSSQDWNDLEATQQSEEFQICSAGPEPLPNTLVLRSICGPSPAARCPTPSSLPTPLPAATWAAFVRNNAGRACYAAPQACFQNNAFTGCMTSGALGFEQCSHVNAWRLQAQQLIARGHLCFPPLCLRPHEILRIACKINPFKPFSCFSRPSSCLLRQKRPSPKRRLDYEVNFPDQVATLQGVQPDPISGRFLTPLELQPWKCALHGRPEKARLPVQIITQSPGAAVLASQVPAQESFLLLNGSPQSAHALQDHISYAGRVL